MDKIVSLHGLRGCIVSDRYSKFKTNVWKHIMNLCVIRFNISTRIHPKTHRDLKAIKKILYNYFRCYYSAWKDDWRLFLSIDNFIITPPRLIYWIHHQSSRILVASFYTVGEITIVGMSKFLIQLRLPIQFLEL